MSRFPVPSPGLWTSLLVVAEYMRYHVTGDEAALASASRYFSGLALLNNITGKPGRRMVVYRFCAQLTANLLLLCHRRNHVRQCI